jgi:hypothetical protein
MKAVAMGTTRWSRPGTSRHTGAAPFTTASVQETIRRDWRIMLADQDITVDEDGQAWVVVRGCRFRFLRTGSARHPAAMRLESSLQRSWRRWPGSLTAHNVADLMTIIDRERDAARNHLHRSASRSIE